MIDTVCLLILKSKIRFLNDHASWERYLEDGTYERYIRNPNKVEKETGKYFPKLTGFNKRFAQEACVRIEFSAPKLLYLNNLNELEDRDFEEVINVLHERLVTMGLFIAKAELINASVSSVHFSKNILLTNGYTSNHIISEINKIDLKKTFDFAKTKFTNDGQSLYAHTTTHQFVIYDKVADMAKGGKRSIDINQTLYSKTLFTDLTKPALKPEILRFEIRISKKQKLNSLLSGLGFSKKPSFKDVFSVEMSKKIVNSYWLKIIKERQYGLFSVPLSHKDLLRKLFMVNKKIKPKQALYLIGLTLLAKDESGLRQLRTIVTTYSPQTTWYRMVRDMKSMNKLISENNMRDWVKQIEIALDEYKPYKMAKINN